MNDPKGISAAAHHRAAAPPMAAKGEPPGVATLRDVEAIETRGAPALPASTYEAIRRGADLAPDAPALSFFLAVDGHRSPETWTYRALLGRITQTANLFHRLGATKDTVVALALPNLPETHFAIWGGEAAGIVMPMNPMLDGAALGSLLEASGAEILVTTAPQAGADPSRLREALRRAPALKHVLLVTIAGGGAGAPVGADEARRSLAAAARPHVAFHELAPAIAAEDASALASGRVFSTSDPSSWFATGGTTGVPKLAMRTHGNEVANAWSVAQAVGDAIGPGSVALCGLPLFHVNAALVTGLLPFSRGAHVLLATPEGYRAPGLVGRFWEIVEHHRVNVFSGVPTLYSSLLQVPLGERDVTSLRAAICGAAPMPTELLRAFEQRTGVAILEGYGLTEGTCVSSLNPIRGERRAGSIGLRVPGQRMKTVVLDERRAFVRDCEVGEVGAVVVSGPNVFAGYRDPAHDRGLWVDCGDGQRWLDTGDLGRTDADGYFWLTGRRKELIIRGGHNIDPAAIEEPLHRHPGVAVAAAVGRPDAHAGELPVAYVQPRPGAAVDEAELLELLGREIGERAAVPKRVRIVSAIPLTAVGKIYKPELKRREAQDALESALREAGVPFRALEIVQDPSRGTAALVDVDGAAAAEAAHQVLGKFPLPFTVREASDRGSPGELAMSPLPDDVDVLIVGYGPVGAALAGLLGRYGVRTLVVDRAPDVFTAPRAIALDNEALRILQMIGLPGDAFAKVVIPYVRLRCPHVGEFGRIDTGGRVDGHPKLVTFYQPELERALRAHVERQPSVSARTGVEMVRFVEDGAGVTAFLRASGGEESPVRARYLVGADGASSRVRALVGEDFVGETYAEDWLVVDALGVPGDFDHVEFLCDPDRPTPHMVAPGGRTRWEFMLRAGETREEMERDAKVAELLRPWVKPEDLRIERRAVYRFHARACERFAKGRVFLAGDAAHITPPFVGQGLVAGLRDAANLAWKLAWVLRGRAAPAILETYDEERRPHAKKMIALAKFFGQLIMPRSRARAIAVHGAMALARRIPPVRALFDDLGIKPENAFPRGLFVPGGPRRRRGAWFPQGSVRSPAGDITLSDEILGPELALVGLGVDPRATLSADALRRWSLAGGRTVHVAAPGGRAPPCGAGGHEDLDGSLVPGLAVPGWCLVVRPDRTVLHDGPAERADRLVGESLKLLGTPAARR